MWAQRRALIRVGGPTSMLQAAQDVRWCSDVYAGVDLRKRSLVSPLISNVISQSAHVTAARSIDLLRQSPNEVRVNDWVLLRHDGTAVVAQVSEMACIGQIDGGMRTCIHSIGVAGAVEHKDGSIWISKAVLRGSALAWCDEVAITVLSCHDRGEYNQYSYVL
jgi:hypothetical protein